LFSDDDESMTTYVALIHKDPDSDYGVSFPDLPGCVSAGSTLDEAIAMAKEALALHIEGLLDDHENIPAPTAADEIDRDDALLVAAIEVPDNLKVERINLTIPALALQRFDAFAERHSMTRSGLLVEATHRWIAQETVLPAPPWHPIRNEGLGEAFSTIHSNLSERESEQVSAGASSKTRRRQVGTRKDPTQAALMAIQDALAIRDHAGEQLPEDFALETVAKHILRLTRELEKAVQALMEHGVPAQPVRKDRA
jgi:predicted RNase H-like HicB family nuclease